MIARLNEFLANAQTKSERTPVAAEVRTMALMITELTETMMDYAATKHLMVSMAKANPVDGKPGWFISKGAMGFENGHIAKASMQKVLDLLPEEKK